MMTKFILTSLWLIIFLVPGLIWAVGFGIIAAVAWFLKAKETLHFCHMNLLAIDQFLNVGLWGDPDETVSSRLGRAQLSKKPKWFVKPCIRANDALWKFLLDEENHSVSAVERNDYDKERWHWHHVKKNKR